MPTQCCIPLCTIRGYRDENNSKISYLIFPKDKHVRKQWCHAMRREEGKYFQWPQRKSAHAILRRKTSRKHSREKYASNPMLYLKCFHGVLRHAKGSCCLKEPQALQLRQPINQPGLHLANVQTTEFQKI